MRICRPRSSGSGWRRRSARWSRTTGRSTSAPAGASWAAPPAGRWRRGAAPPARSGGVRGPRPRAEARLRQLLAHLAAVRGVPTPSTESVPGVRIADLRAGLTPWTERFERLSVSQAVVSSAAFAVSAPQRRAVLLALRDIAPLDRLLRGRPESLRDLGLLSDLAAPVSKLAAARVAATEAPSDLRATTLAAFQDASALAAGLSGAEFTIELARAGLGGDGAPPLSWSDRQWATLCRRAEALVRRRAENDADRAGFWTALLADGAPTAALELLARNEERSHAHLEALEATVFGGQAGFAADAFVLDHAPALSPTAAGVAVGARSGARGKKDIRLEHVLRGRIAELFVLEDRWVRFCALSSPRRATLLDELLERRGDRDNRWGVESGYVLAQKTLAVHRTALLECASSAALRNAFYSLLDVSRERWPGYDIIDPFGVRQGAAGFRRVEIKAVSVDGARRFVLTSNEFHKARHAPELTVLRLVAVPTRADEAGAVDFGAVRWLADIPNPVGALGLQEQFGLSVRGGQAIFDLDM